MSLRSITPPPQVYVPQTNLHVPPGLCAARDILTCQLDISTCEHEMPSSVRVLEISTCGRDISTCQKHIPVSSLILSTCQLDIIYQVHFF